MNRYTVFWHTQPDLRLKYYQGRIDISAENDLEAMSLARRAVQKQHTDRHVTDIAITAIQRRETDHESKTGES